MEYFYAPPHLISVHTITIDGDEFIHLTHVMRKKPGDAICVVDGVGTAYDATIVEITRRTAQCQIKTTRPRLNEPEIDVTLGVAILKNASKFDFLVEKVTELGVNIIVPLTTERTIVRHAKTDRWQKLALAAMKQSGRCVLPIVKGLASLDDFVHSSSQHKLKLIPHEKAVSPLATIERTGTPDGITLCVGPEGGFSDREIALAQQNGFLSVSLGPRRLRTETAAILAAGVVLCGERRV